MASLGIITGALFLMPAVTAFVGSFFVDETAEAVELEYYPAEPVGRALPLLRGLIEGIKIAFLSLLVYFFALPFVLFAGFGVILYSSPIPICSAANISSSPPCASARSMRQKPCARPTRLTSSSPAW